MRERVENLLHDNTCTRPQLPRNTGYSSIHHLIFYVNNTSIKEFVDKCKTLKY